MKNVKIEMTQNNKTILSCYRNVENDFDIMQSNIKDVFVEQFNIFENLDCSDIDLNKCFNIHIRDWQDRVIDFDLFAYRKYNDVCYTGKDILIYENTLCSKQEVLDLSENNPDKCILSYNFKPRYKIKNKMNFGFELEISCGISSNLKTLIVELVNENLLGDDKIILKSDSSITGQNSVEIVTAPVSIKEIYNIAIKLSDIFKKFDNTAKGHNVGGMHIHCSHLNNNIKVLRLINFIFNNDNYDFLTKISQRNSNRFCEYDITKVADIQEIIDLSLSKKNKKFYNNDRYAALNFTKNTIEFRIFNSNLRRERLLKNLNFVEAILSFISSKKYTKYATNFEEFVNKSRKYKYLKDFIKYSNEQ